MERKIEKGGGEWEQKIKERERRMSLIQFCMREKKMAEQKGEQKVTEKKMETSEKLRRRR